MRAIDRLTLLLLLAIQGPAALRANDFQSVSVVAEPARIDLPEGVENADVTYRFTNSSKQAFEVIDHTVTAFRPGVDRVVETLASLVSDAERELVERRVVLWTQAGVPETLAAEVAALDLAPTALDIVRLSLNWSTTGDTAAESIDPVASVYFTIDDQLGLGDLRDRIVALPRDDRWDALARAALRDDLAGEHAALTSAVIMSDPALAITERFEGWASKYRVEIERHLATVREVQESGVGNVATMSVVLRGLRSLATSR